MATFKTTCRIQNESKGLHEATIYIKDVEDEDEAESLAKQHFIMNVKDTIFYGVTKCERI
jgi:hypothetical protein